jgi:hypothetical protein
MTSIKRKFFWTGTRNRTRRPASDRRCAGRWLAGMKKLYLSSLSLGVWLCANYAMPNDISVSLCVPGEEVLAYEQGMIRVTITNNSNHAIPLLKGLAAQRFQVCLNMETEKRSCAELPYLVDRRFRDWERVRKAKEFLAPGQGYTWEFSAETWLNLTAYMLSAETTNITARVMVAENEWANSATLPFRVRGGLGIFDTSPAVDCHDTKNNKTLEEPFRQIKLNGKSYLFSNDVKRICEVPDDDSPKVLFDSERGEYSISFSKNKKKLLYILKTGELIQEQHGK